MATVADCANHLFMSERRFHEHLSKGVISRQARGAYDLDLVRREYLVHLWVTAGGFGIGRGKAKST